jgi:uncharacterized membrane protein YdbT with pleckstrin-like domain
MHQLGQAAAASIRQKANAMSTILYDCHPAMARSSPLLFALAVLTIPVGIGIIILLVWYLRTLATRLVITDEEIRLERGLLAKEHREIRLSAIRTVQIDQSVMDRMFGVGAVTVYSAGDTPEFTVAGMPDPGRIRDLT